MADAPKILGTDSLRQAYPKLNSAIDNSNDAVAKAEGADDKANTAVTTANEAKTKADSVQSQFDQVVIEGDSSVEAAQARVDAEGKTFNTLKDRLDEGDAQLADASLEIKVRGIRPEYFGAVGDGSADDTKALQNAINWASSNRTFVILQKKYAFKQLELKPGVEIRGLHQHETALNHIGIGTAIISGASGNNLYFKASNFTVHMNERTTIGLDLSKMAMYRLDTVNIFANGSLGTGVRCGMGESLSYAGYYNTFNDCYIQGQTPTGGIGLSKGIEMVNSANSTRLYNCRFDYVDICVYGGANTNHNIFVGCAFEHFNTGIYTEGRAYGVLGCRFELPSGSLSQTGFHISGGGFYNYLSGCHFQNVNRQVLDESTSKLNTFFADYKGNVQELTLNNYALKQAKTIGLTEQTTFISPSNGELVYLNDGTNKGLYFREGAALRGLTFLRATSTAGRPSDVPVGTMVYDNSLQKPIWWSGSIWKDANGSAV